MGGPRADDHRRGRIQLGIRDEPADQRQPAAMPVREPCHLMAAIATITGQGETPVREPVQEHGDQLAEQLRGGLVPALMLLIPLPAAIQRHQHRQGPGTVGEREADQDCQDDPLVAPAIGGVAVGGADGVAMAPLAVDLGAAMLIDGVIAGQRNGACGDEATQDQIGQAVSHGPQRPAAPREDAVIAGGMAGSETADGAEQIGDRAASGSEGSPAHQGEEAWPWAARRLRRPSEARAERLWAGRT